MTTNYMRSWNDQAKLTICDCPMNAAEVEHAVNSSRGRIVNRYQRQSGGYIFIVKYGSGFVIAFRTGTPNA